MGEKCARLGLAVVVLVGVLAGGAGSAKAQTAAPGSGTSVVYQGSYGGEGLALDSAGNLYLGFNASVGLYKSTYSNGSYTTAAISGSPQYLFFGVAVDSNGNVYLADEGATGIWEVVGSGSAYTFTKIITTGFSAAGVAIDGYGNIYTNNYGNSVYKYTLSGGVYTQHVIATGLGIARNMAIDSNGVIYQADQSGGSGSGVVHVYTPSGPVATTTTYTASVLYTCTDGCAGVAVKNGVVYIGDGTQVIKETPNGSGGYTQTLASTGYGEIRGMAVDNNGNVLVSDLNTDKITKVTTTLPDFGSVNVGTTSTQQSIAFVIGTGGTLGAPIVLTQGATGQDFALGTGSTCSGSLSSGASCVVNVTFTPKYPGERYGAVELTNSSGGVITTQLMQGNGSGPEATYTPGTISTVAGNGIGGYSSDGVLATSSEIYNPVGVAVDAAGNMYIADDNNNRVRKVTAATGDISTVAGNGTAGYSGDGGVATSAEMNQVQGVAVDGAGNLYFADYVNNRIRKVTAATGIISTVAGGGSASCTGSTNSVGDGCAATSAVLAVADSVAVDGAGNLYISDQDDNRIRKVTVATGIITTVAGTGTQGYSGDNAAATSAELNLPVGVALDGAGNIYIADRTNNRIRKVTALTGIITTVAGNGTAGYTGDGAAATSAEINAPTAVVVDAAGNLYITDAGNNRIRKVTAGTGFISTVAGNGTAGYNSDGIAATKAELSAPTALTVDGAGNLYITEYSNNRVRKVAATATPLSFATTAVGSTSTDSPQTLTVNNIGNIALTFPIPATGTDPSISTGFSIGNSSTCPQLTTSTFSAGTLASGANCTDLISFAPTTAGSISGQLVNTDNSLNVSPSTQSVGLSGNATDGSQTINFTVPSSPVTYGVSPITLVATGGASGNPVTFSILSGAAYGSLSGTNNSVLTITGAGTIMIAANQAGNSNYFAATQVTQTVVVNQASKTITFPALTSPVTATSTATLAATASNSDPVTYSVTAGAATISGTTITYTTPGSVTIAANSAATANYLAAPAVSQTVTVTVPSSYIAPPTAPGSSSAVQTAYVILPNGGLISSIAVVTNGIAGKDFQLASGGTCAVGTTYTSGQACSVNYIFAPTTTGTRPGAILVYSTGAVLDTTYVSGTGTGATIEYLSPSVIDLPTVNISSPYQIAVDPLDNVYVADNSPQAIYELTDSNGSYSNAAELAGTPGYGSGIALDGAGNVYYTGTSGAVYKASVSSVNATTGNVVVNYGAHTLVASNYDACGVAVDAAGNVFIAYRDPGQVVEVTAAGVTNVLASGQPGPFQVAVDGNDNVFFIGETNHTLYEIPYTNGTYGSPVPITANTSLGMAIDANNDVWVGMSSATTSFQMFPNTGGTTVSTTPAATINGVNYVVGNMAFDTAGNLFYSDGGALHKLITTAPPASLSFPQTFVGQTNSLSFEVANTGNESMSLSESTVSPFQTINSTCTSSLNAGAACNVVATFAPTSAATSSQNLTVTDSGTDSTSGMTVLTGTSVLNTKTINFTAPTTPVAANSVATLVATASNGDPVTFSVISGTATISGSTITYTTAGTVVIAANSAATSSYSAAQQVTQTVVVNQIAQAINFAAPSSPVTYGVSPITLVATGGASGNAVTFSILSGSAYGSLSGTNNSVLTITGAGTIMIAANQAGSTNYAAATQVTQTVIVNKATLTAAIIGTPTKTYDGTTTATLTAANYQLTGLVGTDNFTVNQAAGSYAAASAGAEAVTVTLTSSSFTVVSGSLSNYTLPTSATGAGSITQALASVTPAAATKVYGASDPTFTGTLTGFVASDNVTAAYSRVTGSNVGSYTISAVLSPTAVLVNYNITYNTAQFSITPAPATVTANSVSKTYGTSNPALTATVGGTVNGDTLNYTLGTTATTSSSAGTYPITVTLGSNPNYTVTPVNGILAVTRATPSITVFAPGTITYGTTSLSLSGSLSWNGPVTPSGGVTFLIDSTISVPGTCAVSGSCSATYNSASLSAGSHTLSVGYAGDQNYIAANSSTVQFYVSKATPTITWSNPAAITYGTALSATQLNAMASVPGTLTYTPLAGAVLGAGTHLLQVSLTPTDTTDYTFASAQISLTVNQAAQVIAFTQPPTPVVPGTSVILSATGGASGNPVVFTVLSGNASLASDGVTLTYTGAGNVVVAADQAASADGNYAAATEVTATVVVNPAASAYAAGTVQVTQQSSVLTATLNFPNGGTLGSLNYLTQGAADLDFIGCTDQGQKKSSSGKGGTPRQTTFSCPSSKSKSGAVIPVCSVGTAYAAGQICTVSYIFQPTAPGQRPGGVTALDDSGNLMGSSYITGTGTGPVAVLTPGTISTVAGTYYYGTASGDGGAATSAALKGPQDVTVDAAGNFYIADEAAQTIRKVTAATGIITTVAGNGSPSYSGDGGPATNASLQTPLQVAVDGLGNLYIADSINNRVRKVTAATGIITTVAGSGPIGYNAGLGYLNGGSIGDGGPATSGILCNPTGVAVDGAGNLYISDFYNKSLRMVTAATGIITTIAGNGYYGIASAPGGYGIPITSPLQAPNGLAIDGSGNVYIADVGKQAVWKVTPSTGTFSIVAGNNSSGNYTGDGGPATSAALDNPLGVAVDAAGNVYIADSGNQAVRKVTASTGIITTIAGTGNSGLSGDGGPANVALLNFPDNVAVDGAGNLYIADRANARIREVAASGATHNFADTNVGSTSSDSPATVLVANDGYDPTNTNPLTLSSVSNGTTNFVLDSSNACTTSTSLEPGQTCALAVDFTPQTPGTPITDAVTLVDNSLNNPAATQSVSLSGNSLQQTPGVTVASASITYGIPTVALSATVSFVGSIAPTGAVTFTIDSGAPVAASCTGTMSPITCTATYPSGTLQVVATHAITASIAATPGFLVSSGTNTLTVTPAALTVTAGSYSGVYDGNSHALSACVVSSNPDNLTCTNNPVGPVGPNVGGSTVTPVVSGSTSNYTVTAVNGAWSITQASSVTALSCPASVVYNGTAQTPCTATVTGAGGLSQSVTVTYGANTIVGTASASATFAGDANHTSSTKSTTFAITPAPLTVTAGSYSGTYDGAAHALSGCVVSSNPDGLTCTNSPATVGPDFGSGTVTPLTSGSTDNYSVTKNNGSWSITAKAVTITAGSYSGTYDGAAHAPSACASSYAGVTCANSPASVGPGVGSGAINPVPSFPTGNATDYTVTKTAGSYTITKLAASVTPNAATKVFGTADPVLSGSLSGFLPADGVTATYSRTSGETVAGSPYTISATLSPTAVLSNYAITYNTAGFTITKATPALTWSAPSAITYGTPLSATQLNATSNLTGGTFAYTPSSGTVLTAGSQTLSVVYTPVDTADYTTATASVPLTVGQATPVVTWANPPSIVYGTGTGAAQKTASATGVGGVSLTGTFFYTTPDGTIFGVGTHPLGVAFTPSDSTDYVPVSAYAYITVTKATPTVTWTAPAAITYGTALSSAQLNATASVPGSFSYSPAAGTVLHAGSQTLSVTFTPTDTSNYNPVTTTVPLTVNKATPVITWPTPASITYGTPLSATQLNATANVPGTFAYTASTGANPLGVLLPPGTTALSATITPTDTVDYNSATAYVVFTVSKAQTTTTLAVTTTQTVTGTTATITATVKPQIGGTPTGTVTFYNGSTVLGSSAVGTPFTTGVLPVGTDQITAVYSGDSNFVGSSSSATAVTSIAPTTVQLSSPLAHVFYPASSVSFTVIVPLKNLQLISGTITLYDGNTVIGTYSLPIGGVLAGVTPQLSVGTHTLRAVYGGNAQYPPGQSPVVTVTVSAL